MVLFIYADGGAYDEQKKRSWHINEESQDDPEIGWGIKKILLWSADLLKKVKNAKNGYQDGFNGGRYGIKACIFWFNEILNKVERPVNQEKNRDGQHKFSEEIVFGDQV